jgi:hypothetical protein
VTLKKPKLPEGPDTVKFRILLLESKTRPETEELLTTCITRFSGVVVTVTAYVAVVEAVTVDTVVAVDVLVPDVEAVDVLVSDVEAVDVLVPDVEAVDVLVSDVVVAVEVARVARNVFAKWVPWPGSIG